MLRNLDAMAGRLITCPDGALGPVTGFFFDDVQWVVRYLTVETRYLGRAKRVLLSPRALKAPDWNAPSLALDCLRQEVQAGPAIDEGLFLPFELEEGAARYYGWPRSWRSRSALARRQQPAPEGGSTIVTALEPARHPLLNAERVRGFSVCAADGKAGVLRDLVVDDRSWMVHYLEIGTGSLLFGRRILLPPEWTAGIRPNDRGVQVPFSRAKLRNAPVYDRSLPITRAYENRLFDYYGTPRALRRY